MWIVFAVFKRLFFVFLFRLILTKTWFHYVNRLFSSSNFWKSIVLNALLMYNPSMFNSSNISLKSENHLGWLHSQRCTLANIDQIKWSLSSFSLFRIAEGLKGIFTIFEPSFLVVFIRKHRHCYNFISFPSTMFLFMVDYLMF